MLCYNVTYMTCSTHTRCIETALEEAEALCAHHGSRLTTLRKRVLALIWQSHAPAKAYDLLNKLKKNGEAKPPTIYRALDFLQQQGLVHKLNSQNAYVGCTHPAQAHHCAFLICSQCGEIEECCQPDLMHSVLKAAKKRKFQAETVTMEIEGVCSQCVQQKKRK